MHVPIIQGLIDRRILANYRVEPAALAKLLPSMFRPKLVSGFGMAGICLIRLKHVRPKFLPLNVGIGSENAAHRIAVEWEAAGRRMEGVYVPRRDTSSRLNSFFGGRFFPGEQHHATFRVNETNDDFNVVVDSDDERTHLSISARLSKKLPQTSVFPSLPDASDFFARGSVGYSATSGSGRYDGMELRCKNWSVSPLDVSHMRSSFFENGELFPPDSIHFDCALLMRGIEHEWHGREEICCQEAVGAHH